MQIHVEDYISSQYPNFKNLPNTLKELATKLLKPLLGEGQINIFLDANKARTGYSFVKSMLNYLLVNIKVQKNELLHIPAIGRVIIIANHPLGGLESLALLQSISEIRKDIKIASNSFLSQLQPIENLLISIDKTNTQTYKNSTKSIYKALEQEQIVVMFPSQTVSRADIKEIKDLKWESSFYKIASKTKSTILPIYIKAKNSDSFYLMSRLHKSISTLLLPNELFHSFQKNIEFKIGKQIPYLSYHNPHLNIKQNIKILKKHFCSIADNKKEILKTYNTISPQLSKLEIKRDLQRAMLLGETLDGKRIYLYQATKNSAMLCEIGRLREITFRYVGEGSGKKIDTDKFDLHYKHIILWDADNDELVGAYRIGEANKIIKTIGEDGLYTSRIFKFSDNAMDMLSNGIELGRSFVQPKYWGSRALDYLWQGIGAYIRTHPQTKYLFGAVSISNRFNEYSKALMVDFYTNYFGANSNIIEHKYRYIPEQRFKEQIKSIFCYNDYQRDMNTLKRELEFQGFSLPTLYRQYSEICEVGGVKFYDFGYDMEFSNCLDGFIVVDLSKLKPKKRDRYIASNY